jgi:hypothetical protein
MPVDSTLYAWWFLGCKEGVGRWRKWGNPPQCLRLETLGQPLDNDLDDVAIAIRGDGEDDGALDDGLVSVDGDLVDGAVGGLDLVFVVGFLGWVHGGSDLME